MAIQGSRVTYLDIAEDKVFMASPETPIQEIARTMVDYWIDSIFIVNKHEEILGIITDGVILMLIANNKNLEGVKAGEVMATPVYCVKGDEPIVPYEKLKETFSKKHNRVKRVGIINNQNKLIGVVNMGFLKKIGKFSRSFEITLKKRSNSNE